jgi:2-polyprenyl-3-methyl-5-hydroxy-6-metoxy-1,4-benzoquinol methylase
VIKRLRSKHTEEFLLQLYKSPHDHRIYGRGHDLRVEFTKILAFDMSRDVSAGSVADLSCGNGEIAISLHLHNTYLGDFAPGYHFVGPIEHTIKEIPNVDLYICSETLEHLDNPSLALDLVRKKSKSLVLTTPIGAWEDTNKEHYWAWDREGVESLLANSGWRVETFAILDSTVFGEPYVYGMWGCK